MEFEDIPDELISPPERRLVQTLITEKPRRNSLMVTSFCLLVIVFFSQIYWMDIYGLSEYLPAVNRKIFQEGQWWRIFTATLIHADLGHLLSNMYMLSILSFFIYGHFGYWAYPVFTFLGAGFVNLVSVQTYPLDTRLLGASGLVYLLGGFWLSIYLFVQRQHTVARRIMRVFGMSLMIFFPTSFEATTSYRTHFIGFVVGAIIGLLYFFYNKNKIREHEVYKTFGLPFDGWN